MEELKKYLLQVLGAQIQPKPTGKNLLAGLPMYIGETYEFYDITLFSNRELLIAAPKHEEGFTVSQTEKNLNVLKNKLGKTVVLLLPKITSFNRKRLIDKGINFIVPGNQLYLPDLLMNLRETFFNPNTKRQTETLLPSAQFLLIYHIIHRNNKWKLEAHSFKELAEKTGYSPMAITKAVDNLKYHELIAVTGDKEKQIKFALNRVELWQDAEKRKLLISPVIKKVYVDEMPNANLLPSNASALPEYSNMNPSRQAYLAIEKSLFYSLQKNNALIEANEYEGKYCLEVWKYNPKALVGELDNDAAAVDPLSLYLSLKNSQDERTEMALEQLIDKYIW